MRYKTTDRRTIPSHRIPPSPADIPLQLIPNSQGASPNYSLQDEPQRPNPTTTNTVTSPVKSESTDATGKQVMPMATACANSAGRLSGLGGTSPKTRCIAGKRSQWWAGRPVSNLRPRRALKRKLRLAIVAPVEIF